MNQEYLFVQEQMLRGIKWIQKIYQRDPKAIKAHTITFLLGLLIWLSVLATVGLFSIVTALFLGIALGVFLLIAQVAILLGTDNSLVQDLIDALTRWSDRENSEGELVADPDPDLATDLVTIILDTFLILGALSLVTGKFFFNFMALSFPVLTDIKIETDWLHINFLYLVRTLLNFVQFAILFYLTRRFRRYLKKKIGRDRQDSYDIAFFAPVI